MGATADRTARTAPARAALDQKFLDAADGDPVRAASLRKAHFQRLALKSAQSRRRRTTTTTRGKPATDATALVEQTHIDDSDNVVPMTSPTAVDGACGTETAA